MAPTVASLLSLFIPADGATPSSPVKGLGALPSASKLHDPSHTNCRGLFSPQREKTKKFPCSWHVWETHTSIDDFISTPAARNKATCQPGICASPSGLPASLESLRAVPHASGANVVQPGEPGLSVLFTVPKAHKDTPSRGTSAISFLRLARLVPRELPYFISVPPSSSVPILTRLFDPSPPSSHTGSQSCGLLVVSSSGSPSTVCAWPV